LKIAASTVDMKSTRTYTEVANYSSRTEKGNSNFSNIFAGAGNCTQNQETSNALANKSSKANLENDNSKRDTYVNSDDDLYSDLKTVSSMLWNNYNELGGIVNHDLGSSSDSRALTINALNTNLSNSLNRISNVYSSATNSEISDAARTIQEFRRKILELLFDRFYGLTGMSASDFGINNSYMATTSYTTCEMTYYEEESISFQTAGVAVTEDGREIDFNVNISMTRSFAAYTNITVTNTVSLMDPLVVNVSNAFADIADQAFKFDLDMDGEEEDVVKLKAGSAFLAYDKNEDGKINDGSELFGAKTGDGFLELAEYDEDGNGWIDENDSIFSKLRVWYVDSGGDDVLMDLKGADIGAIYLGNVGTTFSLTDNYNNEKALVRSSGIFLKESGGIGTIQHVDLGFEKAS